MSAIVVDTSVWIEFFRGVTIPEVESALKESRVVLPPLVVAELFSGHLTTKNLDKLKLLVNQIGVIETNLEHWIEVGLLRSRLSSKGVSISTPDAHIAYCAISLKAELASRNKIFKTVALNSSLKLANLL